MQPQNEEKNNEADLEKKAQDTPDQSNINDNTQ